MSEEKLKFVKIERFENYQFIGSYIQTPKEANVILDEINEAEHGQWKVEIVYMTQDQYDALPEFQGY